MGKNKSLAVDKCDIITRLLQGRDMLFQTRRKNKVISIKDEQVWRLRIGYCDVSCCR